MPAGYRGATHAIPGSDVVYSYGTTATVPGGTTGAVVPPGTVAVVPYEYTTSDGDRVRGTAIAGRHVLARPPGSASRPAIAVPPTRSPSDVGVLVRDDGHGPGRHDRTGFSAISTPRTRRQRIPAGRPDPRPCARPPSTDPRHLRPAYPSMAAQSNPGSGVAAPQRCGRVFPHRHSGAGVPRAAAADRPHTPFGAPRPTAPARGRSYPSGGGGTLAPRGPGASSAAPVRGSGFSQASAVWLILAGQRRGLVGTAGPPGGQTHQVCGEQRSRPGHPARDVLGHVVHQIPSAAVDESATPSSSTTAAVQRAQSQLPAARVRSLRSSRSAHPAPRPGFRSPVQL